MPPQAAPCFDHDVPALTSDHSGVARGKKRFRIKLELNEVFPVPHIDDMSNEDIGMIWYDKSDYDSMKQSFIPIIKRLMRGAKVEESNSETARGLEFRTREGAMKRQQNKVQAVQTVLDEQDRQLELGLYDVEKISELYFKVGRPCRELARDLGVKDEEFVKSSISEVTDSEDGKPKKVSGLRKMIRHVRRTSLTWKSARSVASEKSYTSEKSEKPAAE